MEEVGGLLSGLFRRMLMLDWKRRLREGGLEVLACLSEGEIDGVMQWVLGIL